MADSKLITEYSRTKPYTRWWWFRDEIRSEDIKNQLDWIKKNNFGGVEIAWIYPSGQERKGPKWLSKEWSNKVEYAKQYSQEQGLGCDFTFGSMWPFAGSFIKEKDASREFPLQRVQQLDTSWEMRDCGPVNILDHLSKEALKAYSDVMGSALKGALNKGNSALFCDSWELDSRKLWTPGIEEKFYERYGYNLSESMKQKTLEPGVLYDYRKLVSEMIIQNFYKNFTNICHELGTQSRVQCHGSPTDLLEAYANTDIPESESLLFDPPFSRIAASAAALKDKRIVSAESFTCLYGFNPARFKKREFIGDIKLLADSLFANGINHIIWHGMPFNAKDGRNEFYATTHVGPDSAFADKLPEFNNYLEKISEKMQIGKTLSNVAVYLPIEDNWIKDQYPQSMMRPGGIFHYDLRHVRMPKELAGHNPLWLSMGLLKDAKVEDKKLKINNQEFETLYLDVNFLDSTALSRILELGKQGVPICLKHLPYEPSSKSTESYKRNLEELTSLNNITSNLSRSIRPILEGAVLPEYWTRTEGEDTYLFMAHPATKTVTYPLTYHQSDSLGPVSLELTMNLDKKTRTIPITFKQNQSLLLKLDKNMNINYENIDFQF